MKRRKKYVMTQLADEQDEQIRIDPVAAAERLRIKLGVRCDEAVQVAAGAVGDAAITTALLEALEAWRILYAFSHAMSEATGRRVYEVRWVLHEKLPSDFLQRRLIGLRHGGGLAPVVELPELGLKILAAIEAEQQPKPEPVFNAVDDYPQPSSRSLPSID